MGAWNGMRAVMSEDPTYRGDELPRDAHGVPHARGAGLDAPDSARDMIRKVMQEDDRPTRHKRLPKLEPPEPAPARARRRGRDRAANAAPRRRYRLRAGHVWLLAIALVMVWKPLLLPLIVLVAFWIALVCYLTLGHERVAAACARMWSRFAARWPARAARVRHRGDALALWWDGVLDRLPEKWAARLALPDLSGDAPGLPEDAPDPFERLAARNREC